MNAYRSWLLLSLIFILGVGTGVALTVGLGPHLLHPPGEQQLKNRWMTHLTERLKLTQEQQQQIQPILTQAETQMHALHQEEMGRFSAIIESTNDRISSLLNPDQQAELKKMASEWHGFSHHGGKPPGIEGGPGGPDQHAPPPSGKPDALSPGRS